MRNLNKWIEARDRRNSPPQGELFDPGRAAKQQELFKDDIQEQNKLIRQLQAPQEEHDKPLPNQIKLPI